jgi:hypothetical protein
MLLFLLYMASRRRTNTSGHHWFDVTVLNVALYPLDKRLTMLEECTAYLRRIPLLLESLVHHRYYLIVRKLLHHFE